MTPARHLAAQIAETGPEVVFGLPGGGPSLDLIDALQGHGVRFVRAVHEASAALMAGTWGRWSGRAGASLSIKGPGLANQVSGLAACHLEAFPVVAVAEAYPAGAPPARAHKRMDHPALLRGVSKAQGAFAPEGSSFTDWAARAEAEVPGPVQLDLTGEAGEGGEGGEATLPPSDTVRVDHDVKVALDLLRRSRRPLLVAGTLALRRAWGDPLSDLAVPVFSTAAAKGLIDESLPHAGGVYTGVGQELAPETTLLPEADLVVGLGLRSNEVLRAAPFDVPAINVDPLGQTASPGFQFDATLSENHLAEVVDLLAAKSWGADQVVQAGERMRDGLLNHPFLPARVYRILGQHFHREACLVVDTGAFCTIAEHVWTAGSPAAYLGAGQSRYMGAGLPMALATALYQRPRPTLLAVGDGGVGMAFGELKLAVDLRLPLLVALMADGGFASIRHRARELGLTQQPLLMDRPSWHAAAAGLGMDSAVAENEDSLQRALAAWNPETGPLFLECRFDPEPYLTMTQRLR